MFDCNKSCETRKTAEESELRPRQDLHRVHASENIQQAKIRAENLITVPGQAPGTTSSRSLKVLICGQDMGRTTHKGCTKARVTRAMPREDTRCHGSLRPCAV